MYKQCHIYAARRSSNQWRLQVSSDATAEWVKRKFPEADNKPSSHVFQDEAVTISGVLLHYTLHVLILLLSAVQRPVCYWGQGARRCCLLKGGPAPPRPCSVGWFVCCGSRRHSLVISYGVHFHLLGCHSGVELVGPVLNLPRDVAKPKPVASKFLGVFCCKN